MANTALHSTRWPMCRCVAAVALWLAAAAAATDQAPAESFLRLMNRGKAHLDNGDAAEAIASFRKAVEIHPSQVQARLNLASACLFAGQADEAIEQATAVLDLDRGSAAAYYIAGCAHARASRWRQALRAFQQSKALQPGVSAVSFQIALAHRNLDHAEQAIQALRETVSLEPRHVSAHYMLGQLLARAGKREEAMKHLNIHEQIEATVGDLARDENTLQRCEHTRAVVPDHVVQPEVNGIDVRYRDVTEAALPGAGRLGGPVAAIDFERDGWTDLLVRRVGGLQRLQNHEGVFEPLGPAIDVDCGQMRACVVGDVDNDGFEDAVVAGANGAFLVRLGDGAEKVEVRRICQDDARRVLLVDLDHTGKLDLLLLLGDGRLRLLRNRGSGAFDEMTAETGLPTDAHGFAHAVAGDWNRDQTTDVLIARRTGSPLYFQNQLLGMVAPVAITPPLPSGTLIAANDVNNDLRLDAAVAGAGRVDLVFGGQSKRATVEVDGGAVRDLKLVDYDNDGWLDLLVGGDGVRAWRNRGLLGFAETTKAAGLGETAGQAVSEVVPADYDNDGDTDLLVALAGGGLRVLGNDGGDAHRQLRMMLTGTRSNRTGLGVVVEVRAGAFRTSRTVHRLPVEIGVGDRERLDTVTIVWSDQIVQAEVDVPVAMGKPRSFTEPHVSAASCPYLYAWDGSGFRFVTDILGASPLGLRASDDRVIEADADEYVRIGSAERFPPRGGRYVVQVTEELREVLYLDEARLVIADHPADTEVHATDKLRPPPFAPSELVLLGNQRPLLAAFDDRGDDLTDRLRGIDGELFSPRLYKPQLRGWAHPFSVTLDFGPLPAKAPLVLAVTGWLQYGGATANVAASHDRALGSPFPVLECRTGDGRWHALDVVVGAPAGKTKTILVDLHGHLPSGARQMRLSSALEIHFDRIALLQRLDPARLRTERLTPVMADLHWRGFGCVVPKRAGQPSKPQHDCLLEAPPWRHVPAGWCTRYGDVRGLVSRRDDALVVMNAGDALTLAFEARMGAPQPGWRREFFLYSVGWDKDADYHVRSGRTVGPLPFHGLDDQTYGTSRASLNAAGARRGAWFERYNTRWVGPFPPRSSRDDAVGPVTSRER